MKIEKETIANLNRTWQTRKCHEDDAFTDFSVCQTECNTCWGGDTINDTFGDR